MDTVAMAPKWLFALLFETYGWLAAPAPPVVATHVLTLAALKRPIMQALGLWRPTLVLPPTVRVPSPTCNAAPLTLSHSLSHTLSRVGNLGDSRAIIGRVDDNMGALRVIELTSDQTPHRYHPRRTEGTKGSTRSCWEVAAQVPRQTSDEREGPKSDPPSPAGVSWRGWITEPTSDAVGFGRSEDERKRLLACGAIVEISTYEVKKGRKTYKSFDDMCANATHLDPLRVYVKGAMAPGLALSRSIGDGIGKVRAASSRRPWVRRDVAEAEAEARERQHG